jgi:hypothetical protein
MVIGAILALRCLRSGVPLSSIEHLRIIVKYVLLLTMLMLLAVPFALMGTACSVYHVARPPDEAEGRSTIVDEMSYISYGHQPITSEQLTPSRSLASFGRFFFV